MDVEPEIEPSQLADGMLWLVRGIAIASLALPLVLLEEPWAYAGPIAGPLGAAAVFLGILYIVRATPRTAVSGLLLVLAAVAVPLRLAAELGRFLGAPPTSEQAVLRTPDTSLQAWDVVALVTLAVTFVGVILLARHLRSVLPGVAGDRWRQVLIAWVVAAVSLPLALLTGALELLLLAAAIVITAGVLLLLSLLATYRAAADDDLDREFPG